MNKQGPGYGMTNGTEILYTMSTTLKVETKSENLDGINKNLEVQNFV